MLVAVFRDSPSLHLVNRLQVLGECIVVKNDILPADATLVIHHLDDLSLCISVKLDIVALTNLVDVEVLPKS